ncbi:MAG: mobile mystery protein B [Ignavibacteria bacterium]|nr:mobile mystery protein B [Ignavibacteria bacterium]
MGLNISYIEGQTPIDEDEKEDLLIKTITTRSELDEFEQLNIESAVEWSLKRKFDVSKILTDDFVRELHKRMFSNVWKWAGQYRNTNKNLGVDKYFIREELKKLFDDCKYWIENKIFIEEEIAVRFSHRIVSIHPFPNGNGRHSRLIADILIKELGKPVFTWGDITLTKSGEARTKYLSALINADENDYSILIKFARE